MPLTALDPNTARIVIDLQKGILVLPFVHTTAGVGLLTSLYLARHFGRFHGGNAPERP